MSETVTLHPLTGPPGSRLRELLGAGLEPFTPLRAGTGCFERIVADVTGPGSSLEGAERGLPAGAARAEAIAVRLRRGGAELAWGTPVVVPDLRSLLARCHARGSSSVELARADPTLVCELQLGAWFEGSWRMRLLRRALGGRRPPALARSALASPALLLIATDLAFWSGVRARASAEEWRRLTVSSYVALIYHRFAGSLAPGQERIDIAPERFARQLRVLRVTGFRPVPAEQLLSFHDREAESLPRRSVVITVDDALADCVEPLSRHSGWLPQLFVSTRELGGSAHWIAGEPLASWSDVQGLAAVGVAIGSHARRHRRLTELDPAERAGELAGSLADLRDRLGSALEIVAFPHGDHDPEVCRAARAAGFRAAYTTHKGRNGAGTDRHCLRRVSVHGHDGALAILWKAITGESLPAPWLRLRALRLASRR